jgi:Polyketide cyclase / dehydrase and lipid transport
VIEAPVEHVWACVGDPNRYPDWAGNVISVTGLATVERDAEFQQVSKSPLGRAETTFRIEELDDLRAIKLRCQQSGYYSRWVLTEAQSSTFADIEIGIDPMAIQYRVFFGALGKRYFRRLVEQALDGLRTAVQRGVGPSQRHRIPEESL